MGKKMQKPIKYTIFRTKWGYFGFAGTEHALCRTHLPGPEPEKIKARLLQGVPASEFDRAFFKKMQERVAAYFTGTAVNLGPDIPIDLAGLTPFQTAVLTACRQVQFGQTITYGGLAKKLGQPAAARAVGSALAKNPLPLIIPCHRVIRANNKLGGFSAPGGKNLKSKLLKHEKRCAKKKNSYYC